MKISRTRLFHPFFIGFALMGIVIFTGCESDDDEAQPQEPRVERISIHPEVVEFTDVGEQVDFSVVGLTAEGDTVDTGELEVEWEWWSTDESVFTVEPGGLATGQGPGEAYCVVEATILHKSLKSLNFTGRDSAIVFMF